MQKQYEAYQQNSVLTASPGELTLMLYNGCLKFLNQAKKAVQEKNIEAKHTNLSKAQNIISELMVTLNFDYDIAKDMRKLYDYMNRRLIEANIKNDTDIISEVEGLVTEFRDTWKEALIINRKKQYSTSGLV
ncbi:flagellar export chaperone FliS [Cytobacillus solani]|uniref:Flagellar secretion chaperone FliS n=1 Tax=Cytobacillus solani TaxID=1637975 RepID=A0A0Q3QT44_9BACI|nr:flagellar export chaperone FliS [Cytobacillus solani]KOP72020.1 flagellar biosynthesis protein FliS [Bacillus sp. FJAT-21945]KQL21321.1 flagellar export chaperone FliS [Cytobacillus solani]